MVRFTLTVSLVLIAADTAPSQSFLGATAFDWMQRLDSKKWQDRRSAAFALGKLRSSAAIERLIDTVRSDQSDEVRESAVFALGEISRKTGADRPALSQTLIAALEDHNPLVRRSAAVALGSLGDGSASDALGRALTSGRNRDHSEVRRSIAWALARVGPDGLTHLRTALRDRDNLVQRDAASLEYALDHKILSRRDVRRLLPDLLRCCRTKNREVRKNALHALARVVDETDDEAIRTLENVLTDKSPYSDREVKLNAALTLANIGGAAPDKAVPVLQAALTRGQRQDRRNAAAALGNFREAAGRAVPDLIAVLSSNDAKMRENAAVSLGGIGKKAEPAVPKLVKMVARDSETVEVRAAAANALSHIGRVKAAVDGLPVLLRVLVDPGNPLPVRERIPWALRVHGRTLGENRSVISTFQTILAEKLSPTLWDKDGNGKLDASERRLGKDAVKVLHYDIAFMLAVLRGPDTSKVAMDVLLEWLRDDGTEIWVATDVQTGSSSVEAGSGKTTVTQTGAGDARIMVTQALTAVGPQRLRKRPDIVKQLQRLASDPTIYSDLRIRSKSLLESL